MRRVRVALATTVVTLAVMAPALPAAGAAAPAAPGVTAAAPGTIVQEGGPLTVPAGEEGPVTTWLTVTLPPGTTGPLREKRLAFEVENGRPGSRPGQLVTSTCAVNGGAFAPCPWRSPDPETVEGVWLGFDLPRAEVPAGSSTVTYDITVDTGSGTGWLGLLSSPVELRDQRGVVARGELSFRFVPGTPEAWRRSTPRDRDGVLWQYDATGRTNTPLKPRKRVGGGWNVYDLVV
ncbi:hypothetical protein ACFY40_21115 [Streptomyces sp. NPDC012950]|uniref:hypothetical protein n=1 Tax=Streptomyces sp. NPDC012950 TaxID=3364858 RepID=UPI00368A93BC